VLATRIGLITLLARTLWIQLHRAALTRMRILTATLGTETNTFSPFVTTMRAFEELGIQRGREQPISPNWFTEMMCEWRKLAELEGHEVVESVAAFALPHGITLRSTYETLRDEILEDAARRGPIDVALLFLHGAMVAQGIEDCEGDLIGRLRHELGADAVIGVGLDPHCHLTRRMIENANVIVIGKEYPHTDFVDRSRELYALCRDAHLGRTRPTSASYDCRMINVWPTTTEPMKSFVERMRSLESQERVLSVSFAHGFPWGDAEDVGSRVLVVTDNDPQLAAQLARALGQELWHQRDRLLFRALSVTDALDRASSAPRRPVVLADVADNPGGGAPGDSTFILRAVLERRLARVATGAYYDPVAVDLCHDAGVGAILNLRAGGKLGPTSGDPLDLQVVVRGLSDSHWQRGLASGQSPLGRAAWVEAQGVHLLLVSVRTQVLGPEAFEGLGLNLADIDIIVVKSTQHFHAGFAPIAAEILHVDTPGALTLDFASIPYTRRDGRYWPRVADPFSSTPKP
jgi:microcystin degradation protein MlrC